MKRTLRIHDPYHNPFHNRFHVPVHSRLDEMQAFTHMVWLNEPASRRDGREENHHPRSWKSARAVALTLVLVLVVVFSATLLSR